jgi:uncharacterized protein (TIGR02246 family)
VDKRETPILQVLNDYKAAVFAKDVDAFVALYDENVSVFDMWVVWSYNGVASWRNMTEGWFGSLGSDRVVVNFTDSQAIVADDLAVIHTYVSYKAIDGEGAELRSMDNRLTVTLKRNGDAWRIIHQHSSSPIDAATTKAMFKR